MSNTKFILFDLGGVLIELGKSPFPTSWLDANKTFELSDWFKSDIAQQFEKGLISANDFAQAIKSDLSLPASLKEICHEFTQWPIGQFEGTHELLLRLKDKYTITVLTNTNELHWPRILGEFGIPKYSKHIYSSHLIHLAKPSPKIYHYVLNELDTTPDSVIFFDDNLDNIEAAKSVGIESYLVKGHQQLKDKLLEIGVLEKEVMA